MNDYQNLGWVRFYRKTLNSSVWKNPIVWMVWSWILMKANHKKNNFPFNGKDIIIDRGQFITGINKAIEEIPTLTPQKYRTAINYLKSTGRITIQSNNKFSIITIQKWNDYQKDNIQTNKPLTSQQQTNNKQITTNKNDKNDKNIRIYINKYSKLTDLQEKDFEEIADKYQVPLSFVKSKFDDMEIWAGSMPDNKKIKGRNWRLTLMGFVKQDSLKLRKEASLHESKRGIDARNIT